MKIKLRARAGEARCTGVPRTQRQRDNHKAFTSHFDHSSMRTVPYRPAHCEGRMTSPQFHSQGGWVEIVHSLLLDGRQFEPGFNSKHPLDPEKAYGPGPTPVLPNLVLGTNHLGPPPRIDRPNKNQRNASSQVPPERRQCCTWPRCKIAPPLQPAAHACIPNNPNT